MQKTFTYPKFDYVRPPELAEGRDGHYPVIVVGAGPVGLTAAIDLAHQGRGPHRPRPVDRGGLQPTPPSLGVGVPVSSQLRTPTD